jgi:hypothetical protein
MTLPPTARFTAWAAPDNALSRLVAKDPGTLTPEDAVTACSWCGNAGVAAGCSAPCAAAGISVLEMMGMGEPLGWVPSNPFMPVRTPGDGVPLRLGSLLLELLRDRPHELSDLQYSAAWGNLQQLTISRPAVGKHLVDQGIVALAVAAGSVAVSLCTTAHALYSRPTQKIGASFSEALMRPNPRWPPCARAGQRPRTGRGSAPTTGTRWC